MDFIDFWAKADKFAGKYNASFDDTGAEEYVQAMYDDYIKESRLTRVKVNVWLEKAVSNCFISMDKKPIWVGDNFWAFYEKMPMIFLYQFTISVSAQHIKFPLGDTVYLFGAKKINKNEDFYSAYKMVVFNDDGYHVLARTNDVVFF